MQEIKCLIIIYLILCFYVLNLVFCFLSGMKFTHIKMKTTFRLGHILNIFAKCCMRV